MTEGEIRSLAAACSPDNKMKTPEKQWLRQQIETFYRAQGIGRMGDGDAVLFERVFGRTAEKPSDVLKVRYWRTGRTMPANREVLLALGRALSLNEDGMRTLVCRYYDRNDRVFTRADREDPLYLRRQAAMGALRDEFIGKLHPLYLRQLGIRRDDAGRYFRHLYYLEALSFTAPVKDSPELPGGRVELSSSHLLSVSFASTLQAMMNLEGEILRRNMIRHLLILMTPFVSRARLSDTLETFGFLPLTADHELPSGGRLDALVSGLLAAYESDCAGCPVEDCTLYLKRILRQMDEHLSALENEDLRFMQFKSISR